MKENIYIVFNEENLKKIETKEEPFVYNKYGNEISRTKHLASMQCIKYIYSKSTRIMHDKTCDCVEMISSSNVGTAKRFYVGERYRYCKRCYQKAVYRSGIIDIGNYEIYRKFFNKHHVPIELLYELFVECDAKCVIEKDFIRIRCSEDTWRISLKAQNKDILLYHNNYQRNFFGERIMTKGFHRQNINNNTLVGVLEYIVKYDYYVLHNPKVHFINNIRKIVTKEFERTLEEFSQIEMQNF